MRIAPKILVIEAWQSLPVAIEDGEGERLVEILPLQQCSREDTLHTFDKGLNKLIIGRSPQPAMPPADVKGVIQ